MKKLKKTISAVALFTLFASTAKAQVTKAQVDKMIKEVGLDLTNVTCEIVNYTIGNVSENSIKRLLIQEKAEPNIKTYSVIETGIEIKNYKDGKVFSIVYIPFSDIKRITVRQSSMVLILNE